MAEEFKMAHIKINYDGLEQQASVLNQYIQDYEALNARINILTEKISSGWQGKSSVAFTEMMSKYIAQAKKMTDVIEAFRGYAVGVKTGFEAVDMQCANMIRNSF